MASKAPFVTLSLSLPGGESGKRPVPDPSRSLSLLLACLLAASEGHSFCFAQVGGQGFPLSTRARMSPTGLEGT